MDITKNEQFGINTKILAGICHRCEISSVRLTIE